VQFVAAWQMSPVNKEKGFVLIGELPSPNVCKFCVSVFEVEL